MEQKVRILIADENVEFRMNLRENLTRAGMEIVEEASDGTDILTKIKRTTPDIVFIDIWLPKGDPIQIIKKSKLLFPNPLQAPDFTRSLIAQILTFFLRQAKPEQPSAYRSPWNMRLSLTG